MTSNIISAYKKIAQPKQAIAGRVGRLDYFMFFIFPTLLFPVYVIDLAADILNGGSGLVHSTILLFYFALLWPFVVISIKRLHDVGLSGWFLLSMFVPALGWLMPIGLMFWPGQSGVNEYNSISKIPIPES
jgi:uncharacterized membrane protein YhaH (DUF805 family)